MTEALFKKYSDELWNIAVMAGVYDEDTADSAAAFDTVLRQFALLNEKEIDKD